MPPIDSGPTSKCNGESKDHSQYLSQPWTPSLVWDAVFDMRALAILALLGTAAIAGVLLDHGAVSSVLTGNNEVLGTTLVHKHKPQATPLPQPTSYLYVRELHSSLLLLGYDPLGAFSVTKAELVLVAGRKYTFCLDYGKQVHLGISFFVPAVGEPDAKELTSELMSQTCLQHSHPILLEMELFTDYYYMLPYKYSPGDPEFNQVSILQSYSSFSLENDDFLRQSVSNQGDSPLCGMHASVAAASHRDLTLYSYSEMQMCAMDELPYCKSNHRQVFHRVDATLPRADGFLAVASISSRGLVEESIAPSSNMPGRFGYCMATNPSAIEVELQCGGLLPVTLTPGMVKRVDYDYCRCPGVAGTLSNYALLHYSDDVGVYYTNLNTCYLEFRPEVSTNLTPAQSHLRHTVPMNMCRNQRLIADSKTVFFKAVSKLTEPSEQACDATNHSPVYEMLQCDGLVSSYIPPRSSRNVDIRFCTNECSSTQISTAIRQKTCQVELSGRDVVISTLQLPEQVCLEIGSNAVLKLSTTRVMSSTPHPPCPDSLRLAERMNQYPPVLTPFPSVRAIQETVLSSGSTVIVFPIFTDFEVFFKNPENAQKVYSTVPGQHYRQCSEAKRVASESEDAIFTCFTGTHAVVVYGWDFTGENPHWLVQNSYGKLWGDEGRFKLAVSTAVHRMFHWEKECGAEESGVVLQEHHRGNVERKCVLSETPGNIESVVVQYSSTVCDVGAPLRLHKTLDPTVETEIPEATGCCLAKVNSECHQTMGSVSLDYNEVSRLTMLRNSGDLPVQVWMRSQEDPIELEPWQELEYGIEDCIDYLTKEYFSPTPVVSVCAGFLRWLCTRIGI